MKLKVTYPFTKGQKTYKAGDTINIKKEEVDPVKDYVDVKSADSVEDAAEDRSMEGQGDVKKKGEEDKDE